MQEHANGGDVPGKGDENGSLSAKQTALLIAGEMAGSGVLALPRAMVRTGKCCIDFSYNNNSPVTPISTL